MIIPSDDEPVIASVASSWFIGDDRTKRANLPVATRKEGEPELWQQHLEVLSANDEGEGQRRRGEWGRQLDA